MTVCLFHDEASTNQVDVFPVDSTSNYQEINVLEGEYDVKVIKRTGTTCLYRIFAITIEQVEKCEPFYTYTVRLDKMVFEEANSTISVD